MPTLPCLALLLLANTVELGAVDNRRGVVLGDQPLLALDPVWVASGDWQNVYRFPTDLQPERSAEGDARREVRVHEGQHGRVTETTTTTPEAVTLRYDFAFAPLAGGSNLQWVLRLEPQRFDGGSVSGEGARVLAPRPIEGARLDGVRTLNVVQPAADLAFEVAGSSGTWQFSDQRAAEWAKAYRLEWNRPFEEGGKREGWVSLTVRAKPAGDVLVPLTTGAAATAGGVPFQLGTLPETVGRPLAALLVWHTATGSGPRGQAAGELEVAWADGQTATVPFHWEQEVTAPDDDPRSLPGGVLRPLPDGRPAWVTVWVNPRPDQPIARLTPRRLGGGWELLAATGVAAGVSAERLAAVTAGASQTATEEVVVSLDGPWRAQPPGGEEREVPVPSRWEQLPGLREVHELVYRRTFDVPAAMRGQRVVLRFDAVGEHAEVRVNGRPAGRALAGPLPVEFDVTELVAAPSTGNALEVRVADDTHFAVPRPSSDWRNLRHFIPHGIGGNNRKGLFQSVTLRGRPPVWVADAKIVTSVRERTLTVTWEVFNPQRAAVSAKLGGTVRPWGGGPVAATLPEQAVDLPGQMLTTVTASMPWQDAKLWQPNHPHLYELRSRLASPEGVRLCRRDDRFGFREVGFEGIEFRLNGLRCNLRGESPSYAERAGSMDTRAACERLVKRSLAANFNVLRFHAAPAPPHMLEVCDELGMLVIDESAIYASWQMLMPEHPDWLPECRRHLARWVRRDRNHPSVVLWSAENEGLNVNVLSPAQLGAFREEIDRHDGTRPVIFDGDGTGLGASPASVKHYVRTIEDLQDRGGRSSGYGRDMRTDIYWAAAYSQDVPLGCGEFLFPANDAMRARTPELIGMMGLQTRGYRYANWFDIRPYNPFYSGYQSDAGVKPELQAAWDLLVKSFAAVAVFDKAYDELGPFPDPPALPVGQPAERTLIVYNDTFEGEAVTLEWAVSQDERRVGGETRELRIPLGGHVEVPITFTPDRPGPLALTLVSRKGGEETFRDVRTFEAK